MSIDTCSTLARTRALLDAIRKVTPLPVRTLINTHHHGDHTYGNFMFPEATIVGHEAVRAALLAWGKPPAADFWTEVDWGEIELAPPFLTYSERVTIHMDSLAAEVFHVGTPAHTNNDSLIWIPERRVLFCGDLVFNEGTPFLVHGSVRGRWTSSIGWRHWLRRRSCRATARSADPRIVPLTRSYLHFLQETAARGVAAGPTPLETALETDLGPYAGWLDRERIVGNLHRAFAEATDAEPGAEIDAGQALLDMVTFNGGQPLACHA